MAIVIIKVLCITQTVFEVWEKDIVVASEITVTYDNTSSF